MIMDTVSAKGILDRAVVSRLLLQLRNTPVRDSKALYASSETFCQGLCLPLMNLVDARETAQARRAKHSEKKWPEHTRALAPLKLGDTVMVENQSGNHPLC
jgi:hypothetical protein